MATPARQREALETRFCRGLRASRSVLLESNDMSKSRFSVRSAEGLRLAERRGRPTTSPEGLGGGGSLVREILREHPGVDPSAAGDCFSDGHPVPHVGVRLQCHVALQVGLFVKSFLVLIIATAYLWRPYLRRVQVREQVVPRPRAPGKVVAVTWAAPYLSLDRCRTPGRSVPGSHDVEWACLSS